MRCRSSFNFFFAFILRLSRCFICNFFIWVFSSCFISFCFVYFAFLSVYLLFLLIFFWVSITHWVCAWMLQWWPTNLMPKSTNQQTEHAVHRPYRTPPPGFNLFYLVYLFWSSLLFPFVFFLFGFCYILIFIQ
jgi:hypothetical protein